MASPRGVQQSSKIKHLEIGGEHNFSTCFHRYPGCDPHQGAREIAPSHGPPSRMKTAAPTGIGSGGESGNVNSDWRKFYRIGRPLTSRDGFQRYEPCVHEALLTLGDFGSGYVLTTGDTSCHFDTFPQAYEAAWALNYFANRTVFIDASLEHELAGVR